MSPSPPTREAVQEARRRIGACLELDKFGNYIQRHDHLNLAGLELTNEVLESEFSGADLGLRNFRLADLSHLRYLDLTGNQLTELPACVTTFKDLKWLGLNFNRLTKLPESLGALTRLERLYLRGNALRDLPESVGALASLLELDASGNQLEGLPVSLLPLLRKGGPEFKPAGNTVHLDVSGNPCQAATAAEQGRETLIAFLEELEKGAGRPQGKLLLVGEGRVGKSSLLRALLNLNHDQNLLSTHGSKIESWEVEGVPGQRHPVRLNCWDFSGQEQMRETHQMFFTAPALYLLVWDPDRNKRDSAENLHEWLWLIHQSQREGARARVLIVATNHRTRDQHEPDNKTELMKEFGPGGAGILTGYCSVESDDQKGPRTGISEVIAWVRKQIAEDRTFAQAVPASWERVAEACIATEKPVLSWDEFVQLCNPPPDENPARRRARKHQGPIGEAVMRLVDAESVARQLNALGRIVWYGDDEGLRDHVIVCPDWLSKVISYVFERASLAATPDSPATPLGKGLVSRATMDTLWRNPETKDETGKEERGYDEELFPVFRRLMQKFDLIQPLAPRSIPNASLGAKEEAEFYLVPARLSREIPATWDKDWRGEEAITLRLSLLSRGLRGSDAPAPLNQWLARGVFARLMVWLHPLAQGREHSPNAAHWERGLRLRDAMLGEARISADEHEIYFEGTKELRGELVTALRTLLGEIRQRFGIEIGFTEQVACQPAKRPNEKTPPQCSKKLKERRYFDPQFLKKCREPDDGDEPELQFRCGQQDCKYRIDVTRSLHGVSEASTKIEMQLDRIEESVTRTEKGVARLEDFARDLIERHHERLESLLLKSHGKLTEELRTAAREFLAEVKPRALEALREFGSDVTREGPSLFSIENADGTKFWTELGPSFATKVIVHLHCEHTLLPASWLKHNAKSPPGAFEFEQMKPWLQKAAPMIKGLGRVLAVAKPFAAAIGEAESQHLIKEPAELIKGLAEELFAKEGKHGGPAPKGGETFYPRRPVTGEGEVLKDLHKFLRDKLKVPELHRAPGLGLVRVINKAHDRYAWVHPLYASHYGGEM